LAGRNYLFGPVEKALALVGHPYRGPLRRSHYNRMYALGGLERFSAVVGRGIG
jgi:hypothetical protein